MLTSHGGKHGYTSASPPCCTFGRVEHRIYSKTRGDVSPAGSHSNDTPRRVGAGPRICPLLSYDFGSGSPAYHCNHVLDVGGGDALLQQKSRMGTEPSDALRRPLSAGADAGGVSECVAFRLGRAGRKGIRSPS